MKSKKSILWFSAILAITALFVGCTSTPPSPSPAPAQTQTDTTSVPQDSAQKKALQFEDAIGNQIILQECPTRVVSLFGSYGEIWTLAGGKLIGVTQDMINEGRIERTDDIKMVGSNTEINVEEVIALNPDFVILSSNVSQQRKVAQTLEQAGIVCAFFDVEMFEDYLTVLKIFTDITERQDLYEQNGLTVQKQVEELRAKALEVQQMPTILFVRAFSTGAKAKAEDNMTGTMLRELGTDNIAARHQTLLEDLSIEAIITEDPDYIFVVTMGSDSQKALDALQAGIQSNPAWNTLKAVQNGHYIILPKDLFHYKPNARWGEAYEYLAKTLYPEVFQ